jgi:hypothetical protein
MKFTFFLYDDTKLKKKFFVNPIKKIKSIFLYNKLILEYKQKGFGRAADMIKEEYKKRIILIEKNVNEYSDVDIQKFASTYIPLYRAFGKMVKQSDLCLERSMALTYALISMGIPAKLMIGKAKYHINNNFSFHAWVEIYGRPLNDHDGMHKQWNVVYMLPKSINTIK